MDEPSRDRQGAVRASAEKPLLDVRDWDVFLVSGAPCS
jgi:hypothetical protein